MAKTQAEIKNAYAKKAYDDVRLQVKKGTKQALQDVAEQKGTKITRLYQNSLKEAVQGRYRRGNRAVKE